MSNLPVLALITPCYNEEESVEKSCFVLLSTLNNLIENRLISENSYISVIDDGSTDEAWNILSEIAKNETKIKIIKFVCNFGHQKALLAGMRENCADIYITLDFDLQDDINAISEMIEKYKRNHVDIVYSVRNKRTVDSFIKRVLTNIYYKFNKIINSTQIPNCADFRLVTNKVVNYLRKINDNNIYLRGLLINLNFKYDVIYIERKKRNAGVPKYTIQKLIELAIDGITSSNKLPRLIFIPAVLCFVVSLFKLDTLFFVSSLNLFAFAILGEYITKIYSETKNRPNYIIENKVNYD